MARDYSELTETEKLLRTLIYAIENRDQPAEPGQPHNTLLESSTIGEAYLNYKLIEAKEFARKIGTPLV